MSEVVEVAAHVIAFAELPSHEDPGDSGACNEHACTPLAHHCGCHATMSAQPSRCTHHVVMRVATKLDPSVVVSGLGRVCEPPPLRPPIA